MPTTPTHEITIPPINHREAIREAHPLKVPENNILLTTRQAMQMHAAKDMMAPI